jgi:hypothetical protein
MKRKSLLLQSVSVGVVGAIVGASTAGNAKAIKQTNDIAKGTQLVAHAVTSAGSYIGPTIFPNFVTGARYEAPAVQHKPVARDRP